MTHRITILCDNTVGPVSGTLGEHGFAALVEWEGGSLLFDTGMGETLLRNAQRLGRNLAAVPRVVISHGHYDHGGGLWPLLRTCGSKTVLAHPGIFAPRYRVKDTGDPLSIGIPFDEAFLRGQGAQFDFNDRFREVGPGLYLTGEVPRTTAFETGDTGLFCDEAGCRPDPISDDQSLVIRTERGLVLLLGCCHAGVVNTARWALECTGETVVHTVIGGTHLGFCGREQLDETVKSLRELGVHKLVGSHCTGFAAAARLMHEFPGRFHPSAVGYTLEV
ncbi:MBL fold metallo-hydrolase [Geobacter sulfurreducens]|uniref:MBL fold metallo-hydrolase n=1 Tax=Geobacter sulfurreducens TaxID=35554 RepID=UPI0001D8F4BC|nr:MBL fold metallo-hydrolase [Geobacter sulfurreducens]ADI83228.1 metal-dependent hydrolase, beta-lactamase superfamily II [Geobacter sulfurreducens KN400]AJY70122.1 beta-lactamase [Geobacter sulfurreducens]UTG93094.1 MBL fold metallo-hydrolase [Geobacter sulfurreducens]